MLIKAVSRIVVLLLLASVSAVGQDCGEDRTVRATAMLAGFYPELKQHALYVSVYDLKQFNSADWFRSFSLVLEPMPNDSHPGELKDDYLPLISRFTFRKDGLLAAWWFEAGTTDVRMRSVFGTFRRPVKSQSVVAEVDAHPEWSELEIIKALEKAGAVALPGPGKEGLENFDMEALGTIFPEFRIISATFVYRNENAYKEGRPSANLLWRVEFATQLRNQDVHYVAAVDSITGKPLSIDLVSHVE